MIITRQIIRLWGVLLLAGLVQTGAAAWSSVAVAADRDAEINAAVKSALNTDAALKADNIDVQTSNGMVHLRGLVDTRIEVQDAGNIAKGVPGVTSVMNELRSNNGN